MVDDDPVINDVSITLFGRWSTARLYIAIAEQEKPTFTTGGIQELAGIEDDGTGIVSKELKKLLDLGLIRRVARRGKFERVPSKFWEDLPAALDDAVAALRALREQR